MNNMTDRVIVQGESNIEIIKHRIYEVQGMRLKSQFVTSSLEMANIENNTQFVVENFNRKIMKETEQDAIMAA